MHKLGIARHPISGVGRLVHISEYDQARPDGDQTQKVIPIFANNGLIDGFVWRDHPVFSGLVSWFGNIKRLFPDPFDTRGKRKS